MRLHALLFGVALVAVVGPASADEMDVCATAAERAQPKRKAGELTAARAELVTCSRSVCPAVIRNDCQKWLADVDKAIPTVIFRVVDEAGKDLVDVEVTLDDKPLVAKLDGRPLSVDPGAHTIRYSAAGHAAVSEPIVIRETEKNRLVNVTLKSVTATAPVATTTTPAKAESPKKVVSPIAYVLGGVAAAAIGTGVAFWVIGSGERGDLRDSCAKTSTCSDDAIDGAKTKLVVGDVLVGVGAIAAAAGVYLVLTAKPQASSVTALSIFPTTSGVALGLRGSLPSP